MKKKNMLLNSDELNSVSGGQQILFPLLSSPIWNPEDGWRGWGIARVRDTGSDIAKNKDIKDIEFVENEGLTNLK